MDDSAFDEVFDSAPVMELEEPLDEETNALMYRGFLQGEVKVGTHVIKVRTLRVGEELEASLLAVKYREAIEYPRALATAFTAAAITSVDGHPLIEEKLGPMDETLEAKFEYVLGNFYWPTVSQIHREYVRLMGEMLERYGEVKKD